MRLSTKGRYAITAMLDLALNAKDGHKVTLADISEFQGISLSYLEQLFARLRQAKLVQGTRGPGGGYRLARPAGDISITEIISAVDEKFDKGNHVGQVDPRHAKTQELWEMLSVQIQHYLENITLGTLVEQGQQNLFQADGVSEEVANTSPLWNSGTAAQPATGFSAHR